jgi:hypothetical protein
LAQQVGKLGVGLLGPTQNNGDLSDGLDQLGAGGLAQGRNSFLPRFTILAGHLDLDQLVIVQCALQFFLESFGQAFVAYDDDGLEVVGNGPVFPALFR